MALGDWFMAGLSESTLAFKRHGSFKTMGDVNEINLYHEAFRIIIWCFILLLERVALIQL